MFMSWNTYAVQKPVHFIWKRFNHMWWMNANWTCFPYIFFAWIYLSCISWSTSTGIHQPYYIPKFHKEKLHLSTSRARPYWFPVTSWHSHRKYFMQIGMEFHSTEDAIYCFPLSFPIFFGPFDKLKVAWIAESAYEFRMLRSSLRYAFLQIFPSSLRSYHLSPQTLLYS